MAKARPAAGGGRWVEVQPTRLARWAAGFGERHDGLIAEDAGPECVRLHGGDGALAECRVPFPPLDPIPGATVVEALAAHADRQRRVGVLLVRLGGYGAGVFDGERLIDSKVGSRPVHGRNAAGGQSQQRFARRREKQAHEALRAAADVATRILTPYVADRAVGERLDAVVCGGDRRAVCALRDDPRLTSLFALETEPFLTVADPRLTVLKGVPKAFRAVRIRVVDPTS